jgi:hypothetical protein
VGTANLRDASVTGSKLASGTAVLGDNNDPNGWAGYFNGRVSLCTLETRGGCDLAEPFQMSEGEIPRGALVLSATPAVSLGTSA